MDESQAIPVIYNFDNQFNFSTEREKIDYPDFEKQKSDNCPIENFKVGMKIRSWWSGSKGNESLIYDWLIGQQKIAIHHAPYDKKPFEELCFFRHLSESHISSTDTDKYSKEDRLKQGDWSKNKFPKPPTNFIDRKGLCDFYSKMTLFNTESIEELVFSGPSGVGKTTIATELAHTLKAKCDHIVYLDASHGLLDALRLTAKKSNCISEDKLHSDDSLISEFSMFLANSGKVLLFVDNLNDSQDKEKLGDLLPTTFKKDSAMLTIITSQITDWSDWHTTNFKQELIGLYEPQEIIAYLDKRHLTLSESEIEKLTRVTCSHPYVCRLVLDHIKDSKISIKNYLEKYDNKLIKSAESALNIVWKNIVSTFINSQELEALHLLKQLVFVDKENITQEFIKSFMSITDEEAAQFITILCSNKSLLTEKLDGIFSIHSMLSDLIEGMVEDSLSVRKELLMKFSIFSKNIIGKEWTVDFWKHAFFIVKSLSLTELDGDLNNTANYVRLLYKLAKTAVRFNGYDAILEQRLVEILEKHSSLGENNPELINKVLTALSWLASDKSDYVKAQNYAEQSLALCKEKFAENRSITADAYDLLASTYWEIAQLEKREDNLKQALDLHTISLSMRQSDDPYLLHTLNGLGIVCTDLGGDTNLKLALKYHTEALNMRQAPSVYPIDLAASYNNVACVNYKLGKIAISRKDKLAKLLEAENGHEKARKIRVSTIFESDSYRHLGRVYFWRSKLESTDEGKLNFLKKAEDCHHKSLTMRQDNLSKESPLLAAAYKQFARVCYEIALIEKNVSKKYEGLKKSLFYHEEALKIRKVALPNHRNTANSYYYLSEVLFRLVKEYHKDRRENLDKAKKYIVQAERIMITSKRDLDDTKKIAKLKKEIHSYHGNPPPVLPPLSPIGINGSNLGSISNKSGSFSATRPSSHDKSTSSNSSASLPSSKMPNALVMGEGGRIVHHLVAPVMMEEQVARHLIPNRTTRLRVFDQLPTETKKLAVTGQFFLANANTLSRQKREIVPVSSIKRKSPTSDATFFRTTPKREEVNIQTIHMMIKKT